jgi:hypothetical protein
LANLAEKEEVKEAERLAKEQKLQELALEKQRQREAKEEDKQRKEILRQ